MSKGRRRRGRSGWERAQGASETSSSSGSGTVGDQTDGFTPLSLEEARALTSEALTGVDRDALLAERAEAEAQLRAAEATLGVAPAAQVQEPEQEREEPAQNPHNMEGEQEPIEALDVAALREAAARARRADDNLALAASEAAERPPSGDPQLGTGEGALAPALEAREELPASWRRLVGALISGTGMAIVVGALGWTVYWLLVPIALIAILTVDLRLAGKAAREASAEAAHELAPVGVAPDGLERIRERRSHADLAEARLEAARAERDAAYDLFEELAPGRRPSEVDEIVAEYEAEKAARAEARAAADAEAAQAQAEAEAETEAEAENAPKAEAEVVVDEAPVTAETEDDEVDVSAEAEAEEPAVPATASEWWFGTEEAPAAPATAAAPVRALAERLSAEGREALARIQAQLDALDRVEHAKKSLEWHEANGSAKPADADGKP